MQRGNGFHGLKPKGRRALADLAQAKATGDFEFAGYAVQQIANLDNEARDSASLHQQYAQSQCLSENNLNSLNQL